jgi:hypothetical protein
VDTRGFGESLIDLEEDKGARAVVFGLLAEMSCSSEIDGDSVLEGRLKSRRPPRPGSDLQQQPGGQQSGGQDGSSR